MAYPPNCTLTAWYRVTARTGAGAAVLSSNLLIAPIPAEIRDPSAFRSAELSRAGVEHARLITVQAAALTAQGIDPTPGQRLVVRENGPLGVGVADGGTAVDIQLRRKLASGSLVELVVLEVRDGSVTGGKGGATPGDDQPGGEP